ncbi:MAG: STAS domain-containing protein [Pseudomonadota bacterium]|nr:STAS domain-containing protein [Pseudomonadota bacterium]
MSPGNIKYAERNGIHVLCFEGEIRYFLGPSLGRFLDGLGAGPAPKGFLIDLTQADWLDSTSLGLLARIAKWMQRCGAPKATLFTGGEDITDLLFSVGFDEVFDVVRGGSPNADASEAVRLEAADAPEQLAATMLEAHRILVSLNERNREEFRDVVGLLEAETGSR